METQLPQEELKPRRSGIKRGVYILPSLFTTASLFCGFFSIVKSINGDFVMAAWMILLAGVFDGLDGRVARLTKTQTDFGIEYDSLVDLASFGLAPAIMAFIWGLKDFNRFGWGVAFIFFACGALRLARFNVQSSSVEKRYFQGLPIPAAAYIVSSLIIFQERFAFSHLLFKYILLPLMFCVALLMVSNVRYRSFKHIDFSKPHSFIFLVLAALVLGVIASMPQETLFCASFLFMISGPIEELVHIVRRKNFLERRLALRGLKHSNSANAKVVSISSREEKEANHQI
ncbi:MAG: CDP-diacylglycerol--serine O-phosphatidyltransferase [Deltaproteobacteria bacterium]|nr:CDP-diacylglycerol--serine O-phosphatidyltransferase [Deltaproteobacteria bacterium]